jgi:hypothetical protein
MRRVLTAVLLAGLTLIGVAATANAHPNGTAHASCANASVFGCG